SKSFESIAAYGWTFNFLVLPEGSESVEGLWVTREYFQTVGVQPAVGRAFLESEATSGLTTAIILGHDLWQRRFNGDPAIVGQTVRISRYAQPLTVVGVMPPGLRFLPAPADAQEPNYKLDAQVAYWVPAVADPPRLRRRERAVV